MRLVGRISELSGRFNALTLRERLLLLVALLVVLYMGWDRFSWQPLVQKQQQLSQRLAEASQQQKLVQVELNGLMVRASRDPDKENRRLRDQLKAQLQRLEQQMRSATADLVEPGQMSRMLEQMLLANPELRLLSLKTLGVEALGVGKQSDEPGKTAGPASQAARQDDARAGALVYRHRVELRFSGSYFATLEYLQALERLRGRLFWDSVEYQVADYPEAEVTLVIYTLSLSRGWIGV